MADHCLADVRGGQNVETVLPLASPIRGLVKRDGRLLQPIQITLQYNVANVTAVTKLNGVEVDRRTLSPGPNSFQVLTEPVIALQDVNVNGDRR